MTLVDHINLALIGFAVIICVVKGFKSRIFKTFASISSVFLACFIGIKYNGFVLSDVDVISIENKIFGETWTEKINNAICTVLGTIIMTVLLHITLKQIFKVVDGNFENDIYTQIRDRLRGAIDGLFVFGHENVSCIFLCGGLFQIKCSKVTQTKNLLPEKIDIYKLARILN